MRRQSGEYFIEFPQSPRYRALRYTAWGDDGNVIGEFTAADVIGWHIEMEGSTKCRDLFSASATKFKQWLRESFRNLLTESEEEIEALIAAITPHSFRAGLATDMEADDVPRDRIMKYGRWHSKRAMEQYIRGSLAHRLHDFSFFKLKTKKGKVCRASKRAVVVGQQTDSSDGYDDNSE